MIVLGIESSCDETAAAVVEDGVVRSSVVASQHDLHAEYGGVVPEIASRAHAERILPVIEKGVDEAGLSLRDVQAVAVGNRPGLIGPLLVGVSAAKALSWSLGVPLVGVHHVHAHLHAAMLRAPGESPGETGEDSIYPALGLVVSGGHSSIYRVDAPTELTRLGATIDDAIGEAFDKVASILGLGHPGGPEVEKLAAQGDPSISGFPVSRLKGRPTDFSFSGLKTAVLYAARGVPGPGGVFPREASDLEPSERADIAAGFQRAAVRAVVDRLGNALEALRDDGPPVRTLIAGGGVVANGALRSALESFAPRHALRLRMPRPAWCVDNAAMIAGLGEVITGQGVADGMALRAVPTTGV